MNYRNLTIPEMENEAIRTNNELAITLIDRIKDLEESLLCLSLPDADTERLVEYMKKTLDLPNNY